MDKNLKILATFRDKFTVGLVFMKLHFSLLRVASVSDVWGAFPVTHEQFLDVPAEHDFF
jgi:hypothetical protein